jgi:hypothetical protein
MAYPVDDPTIIEENSVCQELVAKNFYIDMMIRNVIRQYFIKNPLQGFSGANQLFWVEGVSQGRRNDSVEGMRIDLFHEWNPSKAGAVPAVVVKKGDLGSVRLGIADRHMSPGIQDMTGRRTYTRAWAGSLTCFCLSENPLEVDLLALSVAGQLQTFAPELAKVMRLRRLEVSQVKATKPLKEKPTILASPVLIEYGFESTWHLTPHAPKLNHIHTVHSSS